MTTLKIYCFWGSLCGIPISPSFFDQLKLFQWNGETPPPFDTVITAGRFVYVRRLDSETRLCLKGWRSWLSSFHRKGMVRYNIMRINYVIFNWRIKYLKVAAQLNAFCRMINTKSIIYVCLRHVVYYSFLCQLTNKLVDLISADEHNTVVYSYIMLKLLQIYINIRNLEITAQMHQ